MIGNTGTRETKPCSEGGPLVGRLTPPSHSQNIPLELLLGSTYVKRLDENVIIARELTSNRRVP